ncbi:hypothetical protein LTR37_015144 [Vermiconidia calcicola]|uniref:Uncharacterized protein n=1 Tax=Vermiconidia calcicola TaxID=1690605 RepID=A0ACC3MRJ5_9PEZI|nr:hypothetical protein LTR37_015144 [Vermiconidia calcicola]
MARLETDAIVHLDSLANAPSPRPATDRQLQEAHSMTSQCDLLGSAMKSQATTADLLTTEDENNIVETQTVFQSSAARVDLATILSGLNVAVPLLLETRDTRYDLRRWLKTPNSRLCGGEDDRDVDFLKGERFDYCDILECLLDAIAEICNEHTHIESLLSYAARSPYNWRFKQPVAERADPNYLTMEPEHFDGVPRSGLEDDLVDAALELDYLRGISEAIGARIFQGKIKAAKDGLWAETQGLLNCGVISPQWADNECF